MALSSTIVWEVRSGGGANNGGGYKTGSSGTDFSQQNSAQYALTNVTTAAADAILLSASAASDMVGNVVRIVSGTNFIVGYYEIVSVVAGVSITLDRTCTSAAGVSGVVNVGGAVNTLGALGSAAVAGNLICVKNDATYSLTTTNETFTAAGSSTSPIRICGYASTRPTVSTHGDAYQGRTNSNGALVTTNMPVVSYSTGSIDFSGNYIIIESLKITGAKDGITTTVTGNWIRVVRCIITDTPTTGTSAESIRLTGAADIIIDSDVSLVNGGSAGNYAVRFTSEGFIVGCRITSSAVGILTSAPLNIKGCTIFSCVGAGIEAVTTTNPILICDNTIVGGSSDGIKIISTYTSNLTIINNCITDNAGYGMNFQTAACSVSLFNNRTRDNTSGAINLGTDWVAAANYSPVTTDTGGAETDYVNAGGGDYNLIATSPAVNAGLPLNAAIGALQRSQSSSGGTTIVVSGRTQRNLPDIKLT